MFAADLLDALDDLGVTQQVVALRGSSGAAAFHTPVTLGGERPIRGLRVSLRSVWMLHNLVREWKPDVVQAHGGEPLKYVVPAAVGSRARIVYRRIGEAPMLSGQSARRAAHAALARRADLIVAVADSVRRECQSLLQVLPDRLVTIPNAVDRRRIRPSVGRESARRSLGISSSAPVSLFLGALSEEKGPLDQIQVAAQILRTRPDAVHLMAGDGSLRTELEGLAQRKGLDGGIRFLGMREDVSDLLASCDVVVMSSRTEGMPAVVIEGGMAGRPVTSYAVGGIQEVVVDGKTGILVAPSDHRRLADAVIRLFGDAGLRGRLGRAARERCLARFDIRTVAPRYLHVYEDLLAGHGSRAVEGADA